jgi:N-acylglucosamine 2-epimerase
MFSLEMIYKQCYADLFEDFLPFMDAYVVDHKYGGFMCHADRDGTRISTVKRTWFEGRGIWLYSYLYNKFGQNPHYLEVARKGVEFILKSMPEGEEFWPGSFTREGEPLEEVDPPFYGKRSIYGDLFIATGLAEYSKAQGNGEYWDLAKKIAMKSLRIYDTRADYESLPKTDIAEKVVSPRRLGHWMIFLRLATEMLETRCDAEVEGIASRSVEAVMKYHYNPEYGLLNEYLHHDMSRIKNPYGEIVTGHSMEVLWMVLDEALRKGDRELFSEASEWLKRHVEVFWDDLYGGLLEGLLDVNKNQWNTQKWLWVQQEALIGLMIIVAHTDAQWAKEWYERIYGYMREKFLLKQYGLPLWIFLSDRKVSFEPHSDRIENFHLPRFLMLTLQWKREMESSLCTGLFPKE